MFLYLYEMNDFQQFVLLHLCKITGSSFHGKIMDCFIDYFIFKTFFHVLL